MPQRSDAMRVLLVTDWMSGRGGVESYVSWLRDGLRTAGDEARLLTSSAAGAESPADYLAYGSRRPAAQALLQIVNPFAVAGLRHVLKEFRPDVVHVHMFALHLSPAILGVLRGVPTVLSVADYKPACPTSWKLLPDGALCTQRAGVVCWRNGCVSFPHWLRDGPRYAVLRTGLRQVRRVLSCSRSVQRELALAGVDSDVLLLPVPAPAPDFARAPAREPRFVFCGRLSQEKGVSLLIRAFAELRQRVPAARLRIVGDGAQRAHLERLVRDLGLRQAVSFAGWLPPEDVEEELVDAWALVAPSLHREPLGLVAIEAIVRGVPVLASATGGFAETVEEGVTGHLFPNGDERALLERLEAVALGRVFPSHLLPSDVVGRARETYSVERHVRELRRVYEEILPQPPPPGVSRTRRSPVATSTPSMAPSSSASPEARTTR